MDARRGSVFSSRVPASRARDGRRRFAVAGCSAEIVVLSRARGGVGRGWKQACCELGRHLHLTERGSNRQSAIGARSRGSATMVILDRRDVPAWSVPQKHARGAGLRDWGDVMSHVGISSVFLLMTLMLVPTGGTIRAGHHSSSDADRADGAQKRVRLFCCSTFSVLLISLTQLDTRSPS